MPPWILPAVAVALAALPFVVIGARIAAPLVLPGWFKSIAPERRAQIVGAIKGAADLLEAAAKTTANNVDDQAAAILRIVADQGALSLSKAENAFAKEVTDSVLAKRTGILSTSATAKVVKAGGNISHARLYGKVAE